MALAAQKAAGIQLWNVHDDVRIYTGAQRIVNLIGRVDDPDAVESLTYSLNGGPATPVFFKSAASGATRLARPGEFNIDTIDRERLLASNELHMCAARRDGTREAHTWRFPAQTPNADARAFHLDLTGVRHTQEVAQIVDGRWRVSGEENDTRCLEIANADEGLDRVILFGRDNLKTGYTIRARLAVTKWFAASHNVGLLFKWNPHVQGDGTELPSQWSTGLGYYYSRCPGLRVRVGVDVHVNAAGDKVGDNVFAEVPLSRWRYWARRIGRRFIGARPIFAQVVPGIPYWFELQVHDRRHALTVWRSAQRKPAPQLVVTDPPLLLEQGAAGIIAHRCGVRVFNFEIHPD